MAFSWENYRRYHLSNSHVSETFEPETARLSKQINRPVKTPQRHKGVVSSNVYNTEVKRGQSISGRLVRLIRNTAPSTVSNFAN